jgi:biotin operon repressor
MMLTKAGLASLDVLSSGREATPEELATETGYSRQHVYRVLDDLVTGGLLAEARGPNNQRRVRLTDDPVVETYRRLTSKLGHVEWPDLLSPATIRVCWYLDDPRRVATIGDRLGISRQRVHSALTPLKDRAMLNPAGPGYALADDLVPLLEFVRAVVVHEHRKRVREIAPSATIEWCDPRRALVTPTEPEDTEALQAATDWEVTGLAKFRDFGLQFYLADEPAFWYAPDETLTPAEIICHTLAVERDSRRVSYAMLLFERAELRQEVLARTAVWYGLETEVAGMYQGLTDGPRPEETGDVSPPSDTEYEALKEQYDIA